MDSIASRVIAKCGGPEAVSKMVGIDVSQVYRWTYPKERGGTGGVVPTRHQQNLLKRAREDGIELLPADFFEVGQSGEAA